MNNILSTLQIDQRINVTQSNGSHITGILKQLDESKMILYIEEEEGNCTRSYLVNFRNCSSVWQVKR